MSQYAPVDNKRRQRRSGTADDGSGAGVIETDRYIYPHRWCKRLSTLVNQGAMLEIGKGIRVFAKCLVVDGWSRREHLSGDVPEYRRGSQRDTSVGKGRGVLAYARKANPLESKWRPEKKPVRGK